MVLEPEDAVPLKEALDAIKEADAIVMGPGSLYTSVIPNLLVNKISSAVRKSKAYKVYISNIMTQPGETDGFTASDHLKTIQKYGGKDIVECVIANCGAISDELKEKYDKEGAKLVELDEENIKSQGVDLIVGNLIKMESGFIKHDADYLAQILVETIMEKHLLYDKKKIIDEKYSVSEIKYFSAEVCREIPLHSFPCGKEVQPAVLAGVLTREQGAVRQPLPQPYHRGFPETD